MAAMGQDEMTPYRPTCGECGSLIGDVEKHTEWHAGGDTADQRQAVLDFLDSIDHAHLQKAALAGGGMGKDPLQAAIDGMKEAAARL